MEQLAPGVVLSHVGGLPHHDEVMFIMPLLPILLVVTILVTTALDRRGLLGEAGRMIDLKVPLAVVASGLSLGAAAIHFAVIESHLEKDLASGLFFFVLAGFQAIWAQAYILTRASLLAVLAVVVNSGVVAVWLVSRTAGLPFGPEPFVAQPVGLADLVATAFEVTLIWLLAARLGRPSVRTSGGEQIAMQRGVVLATFCLLTVGVLTGVALLMTGSGSVT